MTAARLDIAVSLSRPSFSLVVQETLHCEGITAIIGPNGSGKTTLLRILAGLEQGASGRVSFENEYWQLGKHRVPPHKRGVGYVFQEGRLFPHLTVEGNLKFARPRPDGPRFAFDEIVRALKLEGLLARRPATLSGGEQQRVAIGRALLRAPRLLLMDEPVSALDTASKREILPYIEALPQTFGVPVLYVTHDLDEAARVAREVWALADGRTAARGDAAEVLERIDLWPPAAGAEAGAVLRATVLEREHGMATLGLGEQTLRIPFAAGDPRTTVRLRVHARDVAIATRRPEGLSIRNVLAAEILRIDEADEVHVEVLLAVDDQRLRASITREALAELGLEPGRRVFALVKSVALEGL
ncbi:MAG TPA: molybdenum ABC transporter ATP-binding protein [Gammaproteobacteria bacterium]